MVSGSQLQVAKLAQMCPGAPSVVQSSSAQQHPAAPSSAQQRSAAPSSAQQRSEALSSAQKHTAALSSTQKLCQHSANLKKLSAVFNSFLKRSVALSSFKKLFSRSEQCTMVRFEKKLEDFQSFKLLSLILAVFWYIMAGLNQHFCHYLPQLELFMAKVQKFTM